MVNGKEEKKMATEEVIDVGPDGVLRQQIRAEVETEYQEKFKKEVEDFKTVLSTQNRQAIEKTIADFRKQMEPPKPEDIQKLLEQEYIEFKISIPGKTKGSDKRLLTIRELPQLIEKKFYKRIKEAIVPLTSELEGMKINLEGADTFKRILSVLNAFEPTLDVLAYVASLALNPYGEEEDLDEAWIQKNLSSSRIMQIVNAQVECNRLRDFFLLLSQSKRLVA